MNWNTAINGFRAHLLLERSMSANSLDAYLRDVAKLQQFLELKKLELKPTQVTTELIADLMQYLESMGLEATSQARTLSGLKTFFRFLLLEDAINIAPTDLIEAPKLGRKIPDVLTVEEVDSIFSIVDLTSPSGHRDRAILEVLYACGLRVTELINLKKSKLYFHEGYITVIGKGDKERLVPIGDEAIKHVEFYINNERRRMKVHKDYEDYVFLNFRGKCLTRAWIFLIIKGLCEKAEITKSVSPHTFRHTFATHLIEGGADLKVVQDLMGHESITTTELYTHMDTAYLRETIMMFHPRNKPRKE
ncbi:MAG: tyrosine recombinase [Saprospiraceae bacterium]|nr:tyrosine recombinase [Saprospiraceae bacterium]